MSPEYFTLFGGDAARQRAEAYAADRKDYQVQQLIDEIDPRIFGLDIHARDTEGTQYSWVASAIDFTECPGDSKCTADMGPYGMTYAHTHCAIDGCVMMAIGGGGDDGRGIDGYEDAEGSCAVKDPELGELVNEKCLRRRDLQNATAATLTLFAPEEYEALTEREQAAIVDDCLAAYREDGCNPAAYLARIGKGNLAAYVRVLGSSIAKHVRQTKS